MPKPGGGVLDARAGHAAKMRAAIRATMKKRMGCKTGRGGGRAGGRAKGATLRPLLGASAALASKRVF